MTKRTVVTLRVTAEGFGTRIAVWRGQNAMKVATYYEWLWRKEGHKVEWM